MNIEEQLLAASIRDTIQQADQAVTKLFYLMEGNTPHNIDEGEHADELDGAKVVLRFYVEKVFRDTAILAERLGLQQYRADIVAKQAKFTDLAELEETPWDVIFQSAPLAAARAFFDSLATMTDGRAVTGLGVFETVLENTPKIIAQANLKPENESQVRAKVREVLGFAFRDVVREIPIPKRIKTYRPDIGVVSLMAAAEYKFIDSLQEAKKALDEIYSDMRGYSGHPDWRTFYAVLYMTGPFYTQKDVDEEFRVMKADLSWRPLVLVGPGGRKKAKSRSA